jgi:hypothetical protein
VHKLRTEEFHIFVVWSKGTVFIDEIIDEISNTITIVEHMKISWTKTLFRSNLERFYGDSLKRVTQKILECGDGDFDLLVVKDNHPLYSSRKTSSGIKIVNTNIFDLKAKCRSITKAGHLIHSSDDYNEAKFQYKLITGRSIGLIPNTLNTREVQIFNKDVIGVRGWSSLDEIWNHINDVLDYIVLRNFENLDKELNEEHPDIDLMITDPTKLARLIGLKKRHTSTYRAQYFCVIDGREVNFDLRTPLDGYYPVGFAYQMLKNRIEYKNIYVPNNENHFWSLLYHALFHKRVVSGDYINRLHQKSTDIDSNLVNTLWDRKFISNIMFEYLSYNNWIHCEPSDHSVYYNYYDYKSTNLSVTKRRRTRQALYKLASKLKNRSYQVLNVKFIKNKML